MTDPRDGITRRDFLRGAGPAAVAAALGMSASSCRSGERGEPVRIAQRSPDAGKADNSRTARVVLVRDRAAVKADGSLDFQVVGKMLDQAVTELLGAEDVQSAWRELVKPDDLVGIKTNIWAGLRTPPQVEQMLGRRIAEAGVPGQNIRITDREARKKLADCTALINVRPARSHHWAGMGGCIKNYIVFHEAPWMHHRRSCESLASIWDLFDLKKKTRLNILLVLTPQFYGRGPHGFDPRFVWPYNGILVSSDPVAVDALGAELLRVKRLAYFEGEERPLTPTTHIAAAEQKYGLGVADLKRIQLVRLGWDEEMLI
jgi:hypothetical protein